MEFKTELLIVLPMFFNFYYQIINLETELKKVTVMSYIHLLITPAIQLELVRFALRMQRSMLDLMRSVVLIVDASKTTSLSATQKLKNVRSVHVRTIYAVLIV